LFCGGIVPAGGRMVGSLGERGEMRLGWGVYARAG